MQVIICDSAEQVGSRAADIVEARVRQGPAVLGLATGGSPSGTYRELIRRHREQQLSFRTATAFTLDEYAGLPPDHEQSYYSTIRREFVDHVDAFEPASPDAALHLHRRASDVRARLT
ncbi:MAG: 6-phosphogluconolactonase, partial [Actinomycetes bacterium]